MNSNRLKKSWARFWIRLSGTGTAGKIAAHLAGLFSPPFYSRIELSRLHRKGYFSPRCAIHHDGLHTGKHVFIDDGVLVYKDKDGGSVKIGDRVHIHRNTTIQTGIDGTLSIGNETHIQPRCQFSAYKGPINIGKRVEIAPNCAFYSYNHGVLPDMPVRQQPVFTTGGITIGDDVWLGYGVIVLDGVQIGRDAVIGAGAVVKSDIPEGAIAVGIPAKVIKMRSDLATGK